MVQANVTGLGDMGSLGKGSVAYRLNKYGFNAQSLRTLDVLRKEEWIAFDAVVVEIARQRLNAVADLISAGLTFPLTNAMGKTIVQWERVSDMDPAQRSMDGITRGEQDRLDFAIDSLPVYITHKDFHLSLRVLEASRTLGDSLDTTQASVAARLVSDSLEDGLVNGPAVVSAGATAYGYRNHPNRNTETLTAAWAGATTGASVLGDVIDMMTLAHNDNMFGPYVLYVPKAYWLFLMNDFKAESDRTMLERIRALEGISDVKPIDVLPVDNVLLVQMTRDVVDLIDGEPVQTVQWEVEGGFMINFKVMAIQVPRIKNDYDTRSGIVHGTV